LAPGLDVRGVVSIAGAHRGVVETDEATRQQLAVARASHDREHGADTAEPVMQRRGRQIDVVPAKLFGKALDRVAVDHLADRELCEQARRRHATGNRLWGLGGLRGGDDLAAAATILVDLLLEDVDLGRLVDEALAAVEAHLAQRLGAARTRGDLGVLNLDHLDLAAQPASRPLTTGSRAPPAGRVIGGLVAIAGLDVVLVARIVVHRLLAKASGQHAQQLERELALGSLVLLGTKGCACVPAQLGAQARQFAIEAGEQRDHLVEDARLIARDRALERTQRGDRAFDLFASLGCHVDNQHVAEPILWIQEAAGTDDIISAFASSEARSRCVISTALPSAACTIGNVPSSRRFTSMQYPRRS